MAEYFGTATDLPLLLIHCGAGSYKEEEDVLNGSKEAVREALEAAWPMLDNGASAMDAVCRALEVLEDSPWSNAGFGSVLQSDGGARLSAALMDGERQRLSGVMLVTHLKNPSRLARVLQDRENTVLGPLGAQLLMRELGIAPENPVSSGAIEAWLREQIKSEHKDSRADTVGAVAIDRQGRIVSGTSTGGRYSVPERVSDAVTVAGTYASAYAGISCTGIGEQIVDDGVALRIETRVRDGKSAEEASKIALKEAKERSRHYGWIALDRSGNWGLCHTTPFMPCAMMASGRKEFFLTA